MVNVLISSGKWTRERIYELSKYRRAGHEDARLRLPFRPEYETWKTDYQWAYENARLECFNMMAAKTNFTMWRKNAYEPKQYWTWVDEAERKVGDPLPHYAVTESERKHEFFHRGVEIEYYGIINLSQRAKMIANADRVCEQWDVSRYAVKIHYDKGGTCEVSGVQRPLAQDQNRE